MIVGNNITAMVRTMMYYTEIALNLSGSITDGQIFDPNQVIHKARGKYLNLTDMVRMYHANKRDLYKSNACKIGPLNNANYKLEKTTLYISDKKYDLLNKDDSALAENYINVEAYRHVRRIFPNNDLLNGRYQKLKAEKGKGLQYVDSDSGVFEFEMKEFLNRSTHHSSANYQYINQNGDEKTKMRSYETKKNAYDHTLKKEHVAYTVTDNRLTFDTNTYKCSSPAEKMMYEIHHNPTKARLFPDFAKERMLKPNEWGNNYYNKWKDCPYLGLGDTIIKTGKFGYWSLTQFTFICEEQYKKWHNFNDRLKNHWNIGIEQYFLDETGQYVNYKKMVRFCDEKIREGVINPSKIFNKNCNDSKWKRAQFIIDRAAALIRVKERIKKKQFPIVGGINDFEEAEEYAD